MKRRKRSDRLVQLPLIACISDTREYTEHTLTASEVAVSEKIFEQILLVFTQATASQLL